MAGSSTRDPIPANFESISEAADFWDTHDLSDYEDQTTPVEFEVSLQRRTYLTALEPSLAQRIASFAAGQGVAAETLINVWLSERLAAATAK